MAKGADYDRTIWQGNFNTYMAKAEQEILERIARELFRGEIPRYLDFACGTGRIAQVMELFAETSIGVDVSETMIEQACEKCPNTEFLLGDITRDNLGIEPVDVVTAFRFFGNAQDELRKSALRAINGLLRESGHLVINNHRNPSSIRNRLLRMRGEELDVDLSFAKLTRLLKESGFRVLRTYGIGLWLFRSKLMRPELLNSPRAPWLESLSKLPGTGPLCPDFVLVARKVSSEI
jgi:SAM-dependent methyltransferase